MSQPPSLDELIEFPTDYLFKAFGPGDDAFAAAVRQAVNRVVPVPLDAIKQRPSGGGTYQCVSLLVRLHSRDQLQQVYAQLRTVEGLKFLL